MLSKGCKRRPKPARNVWKTVFEMCHDRLSGEEHQVQGFHKDNNTVQKMATRAGNVKSWLRGPSENLFFMEKSVTGLLNEVFK